MMACARTQDRLSMRSSVSRSRAMTLVEILIVLAVIGIMTGAIVAGTGQTSSARLRQSAALVSGAVRVAYGRASATSNPTRLVFDFTEKTITLEESSGAMLVQARDKSGTGGADPATVAEQEALAETARIVKGPAAPRAAFKAVVDPGFGKGAKPLPSGIEFRSVETAHDDAQRTAGRAYLYFWHGGQTERGVVQLRIGPQDDDDHTLSLVISPLTGKVTVKPGNVPLKLPENASEASEREAPGGN
jgi:general secretion pathway protein H